ncbi:MAG: RNA polymerase sigma factor [Bacteroidaceae bacterium]|nr:RNA polymerase sigma factor [Bacteroidaceae bacterium]
MQANEQEMVAAVSRGRPGSHEAVMERYGQEVFALVVKLVPDVLDAEEVTEDAFVKAFRNIRQYNSTKAAFSTWLCRIAYGLAIDRLRQRRPPTLRLEELNVSGEMGAEDEELFIEEADNHQELLHRMLDAIDSLPPEEQILVTMFHLENRPLRDIAYITGEREGTLATRLHRIRKKLHQIMTDYDKE